MALLSANIADRNNPSITSDAYNRMSGIWDLVETLLGGTKAMRLAGERLLPQHTGEKNIAYGKRRDVTTLYNATEITLNNWVGKPFAEPVSLEDAPQYLENIVDDIDLQGNSLHRFCRSWFREGLAKAFSHVLVSYPTLTEDPEFSLIPRTLADDREDTRRPYWVHIKPENLIFAGYDIIDGKKKLTHIRIRENIIERQGFAEVCRQRIRVIEIGIWQLYEYNPKSTVSNKWDLIAFGETGIDEIPLVTFYSDFSDNMVGKPFIEDLAYMNVTHWQSSSDQRNILTVARFPILAASGVGEDGGNEIVIGPRTLLKTEAPEGKFYYVEHEGAAIEAGSKDLYDLEDRMASYGATYLKKSAAGQTALSKILDTVESTSPIQDAVFSFMNAVQNALRLSAKWSNESETELGKFSMLTDFGVDELNEADLKTLNEMRRNRDLSRKNYLLEMQRRDILADNFNIAANLRQLQNEPKIETPFATGANTGGDDNQGGSSNTNMPTQG